MWKFILGFILLIVSYSITVVPTIINNYVTVSENSNAYKANWTSEDVIKTSICNNSCWQKE